MMKTAAGAQPASNRAAIDQCRRILKLWISRGILCPPACRLPDTRLLSEPPAHARPIRSIGVTEFGLEVALFPTDHPPFDDREQRHEQHQRPQGIDEQGDPDIKSG